MRLPERDKRPHARTDSAARSLLRVVSCAAAALGRALLASSRPSFAALRPAMRAVPLLRSLEHLVPDRLVSVLGVPSACPLALPLGRGRLLVVGCGLSGAQLACEALRLGWARVTLLCRGDVTVRPFDIAEEWVRRHHCSELQPCEKRFYGASNFAERRAILARTRSGGSITPTLRSELVRLCATGRLEVWQRAFVEHADWSEERHEWCVRVHSCCVAPGDTGAPALPPLIDFGTTPTQPDVVVAADAIWLATGHANDAAAVAALDTLRRVRPQTLHSGLPELTPELRWDRHTHVYVAGALAALQLGPDALNLAGAGLSASRIVSDLLSRQSKREQPPPPDWSRRAGGRFGVPSATPAPLAPAA